MAGLLLSVILMCFFHEIQAQAVPPPKLIVNPPVITETDSVTLDCQTPSSLSVSQCHFYTGNRETLETSPCFWTLTGTELLKISHQSSPSEVEVACYYTEHREHGNFPSPFSDTSYITIQSSFHEIQGQALPPPKLTVNPPVITETDSVTLNCQTPSFIPVTRCYFFTATQRISEDVCVQTLMLSELLKMVQRLPAEVEVRCFYDAKSGASSPHSDPSTITINTLPPPKVTVNPLMITETDSVTFNCVTPSSLSVSHCYFYTVNTVAFETFSCRRTLRGTELLKISNQSSPSVVQVKCFYSVQLKYVNFQSPFSDISSVTIQSQKPEMSLQSFEGDDIVFTCSLPGSVKRGTRCNLYFGEVNHPILTTAKQKSSKTKQWFCHFTVPVDDLLRHLDSVQQKDASCDYKLEREQNSLSPRSDRRSLTDIVGRKSSMMSKNSTFTMTAAGSNVTMSSVSTPTTYVNPTSGSLPANLSPTNTVTSAVKTTTNLTPGSSDAGWTVIMFQCFHSCHLYEPDTSSNCNKVVHICGGFWSKRGCRLSGAGASQTSRKKNRQIIFQNKSQHHR
ncbi:uncharacterized protein LOC111568132 isoform X2 [Amphiprion ocellaris]|uniref:uncharacterized protein LOC111568132 isoform X2 n=1 Tax=Amphiprion ocellaris TaxID=80972 RepID=UPI0024117ACA|nr:uncharacterized protein LOC111568132 isoform X2 [Amphiprion ocellaris]